MHAGADCKGDWLWQTRCQLQAGLLPYPQATATSLYAPRSSDGFSSDNLNSSLIVQVDVSPRRLVCSSVLQPAAAPVSAPCRRGPEQKAQAAAAGGETRTGTQRETPQTNHIFPYMHESLPPLICPESDTKLQTPRRDSNKSIKISEIRT